MKPPLLEAASAVPVPFSRLTLTAQLEVLAKPLDATWDVCAALNPFLQKWKEALSSSGLEPMAWPKSASRWLSGEAYADRFFETLEAGMPKKPATASDRAQRDFIAVKLDPANLYPLLWAKR
ncbi:hypothetical protein SDC9_195304 [bioreactor metagenome]|uniref:Uncharacterized protein n=1 Tax=bioreactor metagenome TaxID=1076179 RepID=A0A645I9C4_9ZZZZ